MSEPFDREMRDTHLTGLYRESTGEQPSPDVDSAILAAAHRAVAAKPRPAGSPFGRSWRVPMSIAAVVLLSVSLVTVMRDEAPQLASGPLSDATPFPSARDSKTASNSLPTGTSASPAASPESATGLRLPGAGGVSGQGLKVEKLSQGGLLNKEIAESDRASAANATAGMPAAKSDPPLALSSDAIVRRGASVDAGSQVMREEPAREAFPAARMRQQNPERGMVAPRPPFASAAPPAETASARQLDSASEASAPAAVASTQAPVRAPPASLLGTQSAQPGAASAERRAAAPSGYSRELAALPPEKWLERIEELRRLGRVEEARANLDEFRRRYPSHVLPLGLQELLRP